MAGRRLEIRSSLGRRRRRWDATRCRHMMLASADLFSFCARHAFCYYTLSTLRYAFAITNMRFAAAASFFSVAHICRRHIYDIAMLAPASFTPVFHKNMRARWPEGAAIRPMRHDISPDFRALLCSSFRRVITLLVAMRLSLAITAAPCYYTAVHTSHDI